MEAGEAAFHGGSPLTAWRIARDLLSGFATVPGTRSTRAVLFTKGRPNNSTTRSVKTTRKDRCLVGPPNHLSRTSAKSGSPDYSDATWDDQFGRQALHHLVSLIVRLRTVATPRSGVDREGLMSKTSLST